jgi:fructosamine-3-kinase
MSLRERLQQVLGQTVSSLSSLSGGCVAEVFAATLHDGQKIVSKSGQPGSSLDLEARMLIYLDINTNLPVPKVLHSEDTLLIMTRLPSGHDLSPDAQYHAADLIAALHDQYASHFGFDYDTMIGGLHQPNPKTPTWVAFFRDHRLLYMANESYRANQITLNLLSRLEKLAENIESHLSEPEKPCLIHGDLWGGNILCHSNKITGLIDPAIYFAHPEIELAFSTLFSTFNSLFFDRYREQRPIEPGFFEERLDIYNLYPLLVHTRLFGGHYVSQVERTLRQYGY